MYIDTHTHLTENAFDKDRDEVIQRAIASGVTKMILPNIDENTFEAIAEFIKQYPSTCFATIGIHPTSVNENYKEQLDFVERVVTSRKNELVAIGEIGLDLYWSSTYKVQQQEIFIDQLNLAIASDLPVIIHIRNAFDLLFDCLERVKTEKLRCVFHAFSGSIEICQRIIERCPQSYFGIGGVITFSKKLQKVVQAIDISRLLLETDSPYLTPEPFRRTRNESSYIPCIASCLAQTKKISVTTVADSTTLNAIRLFNLE